VNIAVIGGNRFVGKKLVESLVDKKHNVTIFNRSKSGHKDVTKVRFDRNKDEIDLRNFDCVVDMCLYTLEQFKSIKEHIPRDTRYIFVSSGAVKYKETFGEYATEKENVEMELKRTDLNYTIVRPSYIVGYGNHIRRLEYFIDKLISSKVISVDGGSDYPINLVHADDVVKCFTNIISSTDSLSGKVYNVCGDEETTIDKIIETIKDELEIKEHITEHSSDFVFPNQSFEMDNTRTKQELNMKFTDIKHIIKLFIESWKNENHISKS